MSVRVLPWKPDRLKRRFMVDIRFRRPDGENVRDRTVIEAPTQTQARRWGDAREARLRDGSLTLGKKDSPTFESFVENVWWPTYPPSAGNRHTTIREKRYHLDGHLLPFFGATRLDRIDKLSIDRFVAATLEKTKGKRPEDRTSRNGTLDAPRPLSLKRVKNILATLRKVLVTASEWGVLETRPKFPRIKTPEPSFDFYYADEAVALIGAARNTEERALLHFALHTGARAGEQIALEWGDIDFHSKVVILRRSSTDGVTVETTKSGKGRRVPLSEGLIASLKTIRHAKGLLVFSNADGSPLTLWQLHDRLASAARRAGLRLLRWHDLRHSYASILTIAGTPLVQVKEWLGHSSITMTMRYAHLAPGGGREFLAALDGSLPSVPSDAAPVTLAASHRGNRRGNALLRGRLALEKAGETWRPQGGRSTGVSSGPREMSATQ
jgi:integrase